MAQKHIQEQRKSQQEKDARRDGDFTGNACLNLPGASGSMSEQCKELDGEKPVFLKETDGASCPLAGGDVEPRAVVIQKRHQKSQVHKH